MLKINPVFTAYLCLLARVCSSEPSLVIPLGSYMENVQLSSLFISDNKLHYYVPGYGPREPVDLDCWQAGYDFYLDSKKHLGCNTSQARGMENAARFLYSLLIPYGSYLPGCTGLLKTHEGSRYYLYASCRPSGVNKNTVLNTQKIDITDCPAGHLVNQLGNLVCKTSASPRRQIVSGSYLYSGCDVADSDYNPVLDQITTRCRNIPYSISGVKSAIDSGKDVVYQDQGLKFTDPSKEPAAIHEASLYLPPGNYTLSCRDAAFFPCMGQAGKGLLVAKCLPANIPAQDELSRFKSAFLEDADERCAMHNMGYISNINGQLVCDPEIVFNYNEDPTQADLVETLKCPASK